MAKQVIKRKPEKPEVSLKEKRQISLPWVLIIPFLMILVLYFQSVLDPTLMSKYLGITGFMIVFYLIYSLMKNQLNLLNTLKSDKFWLIYLLFLFTTALSISGSALIGDGIFEWSKYLMGFGLVLLWASYYNEPERTELAKKHFSRVISLMALGAGLLGLFQLLDVLMEFGFKHDKLYLVSGFFAHRNIYCESLFLTLPFSLYGLFYEKGFFRWVASVAAFVSLVLCIGLLSRALWIAFAGSFLLISILFLSVEFSFWKSNPELKKQGVSVFLKIISILIVLFISVIGYAYFNNKGTISGFWESISQVNYYQNYDRLQKWQHSYTLFKENPLLGIGIGDWKIDILRFPPENSEAEYGFLYFQRPHNDYLWVLSESGIFAFIAYCGVFLSALFMIVRRLKATVHSENRNYLYLLSAALVGYMIFSFFSFSKERIEEVVLLSAVFAAILLECKPLSSRNVQAGASDRVIGAFLGILLVFVFYVGYSRMDAERLLVKYQTQNDKNNIQESIRLAEAVYRPFYKMDPVSSPIRFFSGTGYLKLKEYKTAIRHFEEARDLSPNHVQVLNNLAGCYYSDGQIEKAEAIYKKACVLAPKYTDALLSYGVVLFNKKGEENEQNGFVVTAKVDTNEQKEQYKFQLKAMTDKVTADILKNTPDSLLRNEVAQIMKDKHRFVPIARRSYGKHLFAVQLYAEALYKLYKEQKISESEFVALKQKYKCDLKANN